MKDMIALLEEVEDGTAHFVSQDKDEKDLYVSEALLPDGYQVGSLYSVKTNDKEITFKRLKAETETKLDKVSEKRKKLLKRSRFRR
jgi:hypothetical protein